MISVGELIAHLQTLPQDWPVTGYGGDESTGFITKASVVPCNTSVCSDKLYYRDDKGAIQQYQGCYLDIMAGE